MAMQTQQLIPASVEPLSVDDVSLHLRSDDEDTDYIKSLIPRARARFEQWTSRILTNQRWQITTAQFGNGVSLPFSPLRKIISIEYIAHNGDYVALHDYRLVQNGLTVTICPALGRSFPTPAYLTADAVKIVAEFGHAEANEEGEIDNAQVLDVDKYELSKQALLVLIGDWYRNREDTVAVQLHDTPNAFRAISNELSVQVL